MEIGEDLAVWARAEPHVMARLRAVGGDGEPLLAGRNQLDRPADAARRDRGQRGALGERALRPEGAADEWADHMHVFGSIPSCSATPYFRP